MARDLAKHAMVLVSSHCLHTNHFLRRILITQPSKYVMPKLDSCTNPQHNIYPAYCFSESPTYGTWVKLTSSDVHQLRAEPGFEEQGIYFFLNHPIRCVRIVGPIISITNYGANLIILGLDDGSGSTVELKVTRSSVTATAGTASSESKDGLLTDVPGLVIQTPRPGVLNLFSSAIPLCIGTVVKAKGTLCTFRGGRQISLCRLSVIRDTEEEAIAWAELAKFRSEILLRPWFLAPKKVRDLRERQQRELARKSLKADRRRHRERKTRLRNEKTCEKLEQKRKFLEQRFSEGALI